jgi:CRISPR-associated RAMP protein (TIGR02581 family)
MHKRVYNEVTIKMTITPLGPILIKAGDGGFDPTKPDMSFVRTSLNGRETVYLPGSSLKGVIRSHAERLARTVDSSQRRQRHQGRPLACDPLHPHDSCSSKLRPDNDRDLSGAQKHSESCFLCKMFGNTSLASHFRISDAHPTGEYRTEERNGVAIDRVFGSVAVGPFNYETVTTGHFQTKLQLKNFTLAQIGLLALVLRDLSQERVRLGFAKSRGLGLVSIQVNSLTLNYPLCELEEGRLQMPGGRNFESGKLFGVGAFVEEGEGYGYPTPDEIPMPDGYHYVSDGWMGVDVSAPALDENEADWQPLGRACVPGWKAEVENG